MDALKRLLASSPIPLTEPQTLVGLLGVLLLVAGKRLYRLVIIAPGLAAGTMLGLNLSEGQSPGVRFTTVGALALLAAFLLHKVERVAIASAGAFLTVGLARVGAPLVLDTEPPWYVFALGGALGLLLFPSLYQRLLVIITPTIGALCIAWAAGRPTDLLLVGGLILAGVVVQLTLGAKKSE